MCWGGSGGSGGISIFPLYLQPSKLSKQFSIIKKNFQFQCIHLVERTTRRDQLGSLTKTLMILHTSAHIMIWFMLVIIWGKSQILHLSLITLSKSISVPKY